MSQLTVTITDEDEKHLRSHAARVGATEEEVVRDLIRALPVIDEASTSLAAEPDLVDELRAIMSRVPQEELDRVPRDLSENLDHYLYGTPRK